MGRSAGWRVGIGIATPPHVRRWIERRRGRWKGDEERRQRRRRDARARRRTAQTVLTRRNQFLHVFRFALRFNFFRLWLVLGVGVRVLARPGHSWAVAVLRLKRARIIFWNVVVRISTAGAEGRTCACCCTTTTTTSSSTTRLNVQTESGGH